MAHAAPGTPQDQRLGVEIQAIHAESRQRYGSPRVHAELWARGQRVGCKRVARPDVTTLDPTSRNVRDFSFGPVEKVFGRTI